MAGPDWRATGSQSGRLFRSRRLVTGLLGLLALWNGHPSRADLPVVVVREPQITLDLRITTTGPGLTARTASETWTGAPGATYSLNRAVKTPAGDLQLFLALTPTLLPIEERCRIRLVSVGQHLGKIHRLDKTLTLAPERAGLLELWSDPQGTTLVFLVVSAHWKVVPKIVPIKPDAPAVEFVIQSVLESQSGEDVLDEQHLPGLVGSPVEYSYEVRKTESSVSPLAHIAPQEEGRLVIRLLPERIAQGQLEFTAQISLVNSGQVPGQAAAPPEPETPPAPDTPPAPPSPGAPAAPPTPLAPPPPTKRFETLTRETLPLGASLVLAPGGTTFPRLVFRITAFF